jgi:phosphatidylserine/phosphatidylglycerophosphate/cardiolipin synthase-like enzyme
MLPAPSIITHNPVPPYRTLQVWGSLFYPPIKRLTHPLGFYHAGFSDDFDPDTVRSPYFDPAFQMELDDMTGTELTYGNDLRALFNGVESYPEKLRLVAEAKRFLYIAVMTIVADETGRKLIRLMVDRKRAGVDVRLITEGFYTFSVSNFAIGVLEKEGIPVVRVEDKRLNQVDRMFHDKFWIRDGDEAILGGMNVIDYENMATGFDFLNRDTDVRVRGPAVTDLLGRFIALWHRYDREGRSIDSAETYCARQRMNGICRTAVQGDDAAPQKIATLLTRYLEAAKHSFYLTSPGVDYDPERTPPSSVDTLARTMIAKAIVPGFSANVITNGSDGGMGEATSFLRLRVKDATLAGNPLWIDMLTPMINSSGRGINRGTRQAVKPFLSAGIHVYEYCNYIHAKEFYFDRLLVGIASWNFDVNSADKNHEAAIFCLDRGLRRQLERRLVLDMVNAVPVIPQMTGHWSPAVE